MMKVRKAYIGDFDFYYKLKSEPSSIYWGGFSEAPSIEGLQAFWGKYVVQDSIEREHLIMEDGGYQLAMFKQYLKETL